MKWCCNNWVIKFRGAIVGGGGGGNNEEAFTMAWREDKDEEMAPEQQQVTRNKYDINWNCNSIS